MGTRILIAMAVVLFLPVLVKYFERKSIYFPTREIEITPGDFGLDYEDITFRTQDGVELNGWFIPAKPSKVCLLFCHGNGGNISHRLESIRMFHHIGLSVFIFDYRGYGRSRGVATERGTYLDALAAYQWLSKRGEPIFIFGRSLGGTIAIDLATRVEVTGLICESSFTSVMDMAKDIYRFRPPDWSISNRYDALLRIGEVRVPVLFIHSREDKMVPFQHGQRLFEAAREPKEFYILRGGHNEGFLMMGDEYTTTIEKFIKKCTR